MSCLSVFLIHMHPAIKQIGYYNFTESLYERPLVEHIFILLILMIIVFFGSICIDKIRICVSDMIYCTLKICLKSIKLRNKWKFHIQ